ncbi:MAG: DUF4175 family protein, partial [Vicinamibacterales bacterium]
MLEEPRGADRRQELVDVIHRVRNRWRAKLALRGALIVIGGTLTALLLSAGGLEWLRFTPTAIIGFRVAAFIIFAGLVYIGLIQPLRRRVSDGQVALYLEEKDPTLEAAILSAVETSGRTDSENGPSQQLIERLVDQAIARCRTIDDGLAVEREGLRRNAMALGGVALAAALLIAFGPAFLRHGLSALLIPLRSVEASTPYHILIEPGDARIPRGSDQPITARLDGFTSGEATLMYRNSEGAPYEPIPLVAGDEPGEFEVMLFHVEKETDYFVQSNGVRSNTHRLEVVDLPTVENLVLEYHFPSYTGLQPRTVDPGGDIAAITGTEVRLKITPTMETPGGSIRLGDTETAPLTLQADGTLTGALNVTAAGTYRIELQGPQGEQVNASPQYTIDVLDDMDPSVAFRRPGRDTQATSVEVVFAEVRADDDFGVSRVQMFYSVNGGEEKTINLFGGERALPEVTATHTIYLEELGLEPGDFVSYYARATDNDSVAGAKTTTSDIYFVQIRPFKTDFRQAQSMGGGGGAGQQVGQLSQQQRQIVAATFNLVRDRSKMTADKFRETAVFLTLAQARLREQVTELSGQMNSRLDIVDPAFQTIAQALPKAAAEMQAAEENLKALEAREALNPEQRALKLLQDAEQQYEMQVAMQNGGGGGGGGQQMANDLADLFELELDKLENQYEMQQRAEMQSGDQQVDELLEKLKELARRQQQEAERQQRMAQSNRSGGGGGGGDLQRQLAQEAEEAARRLEQLTREQQRQDLRDAARQLQEAANAMRQAAANGSSDGGAQAQSALERLRQAQQRLERNQNGRAERDVQDAMRRAGELAQEQRELADAVNGLDAAGDQRMSRAGQLAERKDEMESQVNDLQRQIEGIANEARRDDRQAARALDEAAGSIADNRIREKIRYTRNTLAGNRNDYARAMEQDIARNLEALEEKLGQAAEAFGEAEAQNALDRALEQTRDLVRGMESLDQRMRDRAERGQDGREGQAGQQGEQGQQGQQGQAGQQAQNGQQGQQGQQGQAGQQGQQGGQPGQGNAQAGGGDMAGGSQFGAGGYAGGWRGGPYTEDDVRQFRRELEEWQRDGQALRQALQNAGMDPRELDGILRDLRNLSSEQNFVDPRSLQDLQSAALDRLKQFEFNLRREADGGNQPLSLSASDEVPAGFRDAIAEYYRSL